MAFIKSFRNTQDWFYLLLSFAPGLFAAVFYGFVSGSMSFVNKIVLTTFSYKYPDVIMFAQIVMTSVILEVCRRLQLCDIPAWTMDRGRHFLVPSICFAIHTTLALAALGDLSIPMYNILRRLLPLANLLMAHFVLKKTPSVKIMVSVLLVVTGCLVAGLGDVQFNFWAYVNALSSVAAQAVYLTYVQKTGIDSGVSTLSVLHLNSINCIPFMFGYIVLTSHIKDAIYFPGNNDPKFLFAFVVNVSLGCVLNYSLFLCATMNSALTTSLVGVIKSALTTVIGFFTFGGVPATILTVSGVTLNTLGGIFYTYAKYIEKKAILSKVTKDIVLPATITSRITYSTSVVELSDTTENETLLNNNERHLNGVVVVADDSDDRTHA